jgi:hypothetical protein
MSSAALADGEEDEDEDGQVVSLSSIRKSLLCQPIPQLVSKPTSRALHPPRAGLSQRGPHLLNSADILSLAETNETPTTDLRTVSPPSDTASSQVLFGHHDNEPDLSDL